MDNVANTSAGNKIAPKESSLPAGKAFKNKKLIITIGFGVIIIIAMVSLFAMFSKKSFPTSENKTKASIKLKTEYQNPFDKNAQYENPFENLK